MTDAEKTAAQSEAIATERKRATDIKAAFPKDAAFALKMIDEGKSLLEAKVRSTPTSSRRATTPRIRRSPPSRRRR